MISAVLTLFAISFILIAQSNRLIDGGCVCTTPIIICYLKTNEEFAVFFSKLNWRIRHITQTMKNRYEPFRYGELEDRFLLPRSACVRN